MNTAEEKPSKEYLIDLYNNQKLSMREIRDKLHINMSLLKSWMDEFEIKRFNLISDQINKSKKPTKEELQSHFNNGLIGKEIAKIYDVKMGSVYRWAKELNCISKKATYKNDSLRQIELNDLQKQFLLGTVLGDGHLDKRESGSVRFMLTHCDKQKDLIIFAKEILGHICINEPKMSSKVKKNGDLAYYWTINTINHTYLKELHDIFYVDNVKIIPPIDVIKQYLTDFALAVLIMDDGWRNKDSQMGLSSECFLEAGNIQLQQMLKQVYDLNSKIYSYFRRGKRYYHIMFNVEESRKLSAIIKPHILPYFTYKLV